MSGKDFLKMLLCIYEYDTNININAERVDASGDLVYDIEATNPYTGDVLYCDCCNGLVYAAQQVLDYMYKIDKDDCLVLEDETVQESSIPDDGHGDNCPGRPSFKWANVPVKFLLDDKWREETMEQWRKEKAEQDERNNFFRTVWEEMDKIHPCNKDKGESCPDRIWFNDCIHNNCKQFHCSSCPKIKEWHKKYDEMIRARNIEWKKFKGID